MAKKNPKKNSKKTKPEAQKLHRLQKEYEILRKDYGNLIIYHNQLTVSFNSVLEDLKDATDRENYLRQILAALINAIANTNDGKGRDLGSIIVDLL